MRVVAIGLILLGVSEAAADKKIQELIPGLEREAGACQTQVAGMLKVATGTATLAKGDETDKADLEKAAIALAKGHVAVAEYCTELGAFVTYLKANADAAYKPIEREIDTRHTKVGALRREAKRIVEELAPITRKMIPRITKLPPAAPEPYKKTPAKFPSGRAVELPVLGGTWKLSGTTLSDVAEYEDKKATANVTTRPAENDCAAQRKLMTKDAEKVGETWKPDGVTWSVTYTRREKSGVHFMVAACAPSGANSMVVVADITLRDEGARLAMQNHMATFGQAMLVARVK